MNLHKTIYGALVASSVAVFAPVASAAVVDFTAGPVGGSAQLSGSIGGGATYTMTGYPVGPNDNQAYDGFGLEDTSPGTIASELAFVTDGHGVGNDEIDTVRNRVESITLTFSKSVYIYGFAALDLYRDLIGADPGEVMYMTTAGGQVFSLNYDAGINGIPGFGGYAETDMFVRTTSVTFTVGATNDSVGKPDAALAAIDVAPVPVPAAGLMLLGALGGLAAMRRRKAA
jgi:hypothetical protein